jgi:hypothetical protein
MISPRASALLAAAALLSSAPMPAQAQAAKGTTAVDEESLQKAQNLLKDPAARKKALEEKPSAKAADEQAGKAAGSEANKEEMYGLASEIMETITKLSGGDPQKMAQLLTEAAANPEAFAAKLPPEQQAKLKALAEKAEQAKKAEAAH